MTEPSPLSRADALFDIVPLATPDCPVHLVIALPSEALRRQPGFPLAALPENGRIASGRGLTARACRASSTGEAAELASCSAWGSERLVRASASEIGPSALAPGALNGFTFSQLRDRKAWNLRYAGFDWRPRPCGPTVPLDWLAVDDAYGGPPAFAPADFVLVGRREAGDEGAAAIADSSGCAAGPDRDAAKCGALLELVERDATGRWWYGRRRRAPIDPAAVEGAGAFTAWLAERARRAWLFDITTDLGIPAMAAASAEPDGRDVALGFAARLDANAAALSALTEMLQMEVSLAAARALGDKAGLWAYWRRRADMATPPLDAALKLPAAPLRRSPPPGPTSHLNALLDACAKARVDLWFAEMTRPEIGVPVFRALSTTLCHYKPRFARTRLSAADAGDLSPAAKRAAPQPLLVI